MTIQRNPMSFWQINMQYQGLLSQLYNPETGEVNEEVDAQLTALSTTAENKCIAVASWIKKLESEKKQIEFMKQEVLEREAAYEKEIEKNMSYLKNNMENCGISEVKCQYFTLRIKQNPWSTDVFDESQVPERFMRTREIVKVETKADKVAIKEEVLKTGVQVAGASVARKTKLEILTDKL
jgi:Siphovirus Gp157